MRAFIFQAVSEAQAVIDLVGDRVLAASNVHERPVTPFVVIKALPSSRGPHSAASFSDWEIWAHDDPGSYVRIDQILEACRFALSSAVSVGSVISAEWQGDSADFVDDQMKTITRSSTYRIAGSVR